MTLVSRLTLIAYLVGGWLLPATHYHAHHGHEACYHFVASHSDATCGQSENEDAEISSRCCGHTEQCETASDAPPREINEYCSAAPQHLTCSGLCALCSARSLSSTTLRHTPTPFSLRDSSRRVVRPETTLLPRLPEGKHFGRGPPEVV